MADLTNAELKQRMAQLIMQHDIDNKNYKKVIDDRDREIAELKSQLFKAEKKVAGANTTKAMSNEVMIKRVLDFRAQLLSVNTIYEKMKYLGFNVDIDTISSILSNIDNLSNELQLYYKQSCKDYEDAIKINNSILKQTLVQEYQQLLDSVSVDLSKNELSDDTQLKIALRKEKKDLLNSLRDFSKNIDDREVAEESQVIAEMEKDFEETKSNVIKFDPDFFNRIKTV
jgi:hypothetical protein